MKRLFILLFSSVIFAQPNIEVKNIKNIKITGGGFILKPKFNRDGQYLSVEDSGGSFDKTENKIWIIDLENISKKIPVKRKYESENALKCGRLQWSFADLDYAYIVVNKKKAKFYKLNYKKLLEEDGSYLDINTETIFGSSYNSKLHSYTISEYMGTDIIFFSYYDELEHQNLYGIFDGERRILLQNVNAFGQMEINHEDDGFLSFTRTNRENNIDLVLMDNPIDSADNQVVISPHLDGYVVYEKKININTSDKIYLSYLAKKNDDDPKSSISNLFIVENPFENSNSEKVVESVYLFNRELETLFNFNHQWHPEYNIIFYIRYNNDSYALGAYDVENKKEIIINNKISGSHHIAISPDGNKIALCGHEFGTLWVGDLVIK